jgi:peptidoglycan/LPS O-acetylase OafA/YrhL
MAQNQRNTVGAFVLIGLGVLFLVGQMFSINVWSIFGFSWPVFVLIPGVIFLTLALTGDRKMSGFVFPGTIITGTGVILLYQNMTNHWESWAYAWTLYPVFVGLALIFNGRRNDREQEARTGRTFVNFGLIAFLVGAAFFELAIFNSNGALTRWLLPLVLIGVGGYWLLTGRTSVLGSKEKRKFADAPRRNGHQSPSGELRRQIDEALKEDAPRDPEPHV